MKKIIETNTEFSKLNNLSIYIIQHVECRVQSYRYPKSDREKDHFTLARRRRREGGRMSTPREESPSWEWMHGQPSRAPEMTLLSNPYTYFRYDLEKTLLFLHPKVLTEWLQNI